jgi:hypothetical protein
VKRRLTIEVEVGDAADRECGECPFRALDWDFGVPGGRYFCSCPAWELAEVTAGRHRACIEAGEDHEGTSRLSQAISRVVGEDARSRPATVLVGPGRAGRSRG